MEVTMPGILIAAAVIIGGIGLVAIALIAIKYTTTGGD
jgi:hypothetical protein